MNNVKKIFVFLALLCGFACAAPQPTLSSNSKIWTLNVSFEHPKQVTVLLPGYKEPVRYWYTILSLTNLTGMDVDFYPQIELMTDTFKFVPAGKCVTKEVYDKIKLENQGKYPFLQSLDKISNEVLQGRDNTQDIAVILPDFDPKAKNIKIFIAGLSNEAVSVEHPVKKDADDKAVKIILRKTLELRYAIPGDEQNRHLQQLIYKGKDWVLR